MTIPIRWQDDVLAFDQAADIRFGAHRAWSVADGKQHIAVYLSDWNNPDPDRLISGIDLLPATDDADWGRPAVFAITVATVSSK